MFVAPVLDRLATHWHLSARTLSVVDMIVSLLIVAHILPECFFGAGWWALLACFLGIVLPSLIEMIFAHCVPQVHFVSRIIVVTGLVFHSYIDGVMIVSVLHASLGEHTHASIFLVLHKIPVALSVWRNTGRKLAWLILCLLALSNLCGYLLHFNIVDSMPFQWHYLSLSFMVGTLLHLSGHRLYH